MSQVEKNKADAECGRAQLALSTEEYQWLSDLVDVSNTTLQCSACPFVFHSDTGVQLRSLESFLQSAWEDARLPGNVSFDRIRSAVSSQVSSSERQRKTRFLSLRTLTVALCVERSINICPAYSEMK